MHQQSREEVFAECEENGEEWAHAEASSPHSLGAQYAGEWLQMDAAARLAERKKYAEKMREFTERHAESSDSLTRWTGWGILISTILTVVYLVYDIFLKQAH